ncbi:MULTISPECIES: site-2 protease family protein [unclassified Arthrobacter]|uniref:site-2 protease family protein n=1 Tax=unclassified Arthrobacter TaxID=235627 RepID=UPI0024DFABE2|nr:MULTISPECIES: site-2 protease family protein [unclassified Arthrobacter]MCC9145427.1 site-2 protease family protein [Arthrobacter sp. zg-Y919]MDK1276655.1 site-2 protease family protein [Arthrobacter sp. zg.Y919]WIB04396.1 site-2 protease family protein [Arthrobacter sp. zg-Y919]
MSSTGPAGTGRREGIPLGSIAGVPVFLAYSWFLIAALIVAVFGPQVRSAFPYLGAGAYAVALGYSILLLLSVLAHEAAHALTARAYHWPTSKIVLTLWGGHTQFGDLRSTPGRSLLVALAGPAANFLLAAAGFGILQLLPDLSVAALVTLVFVYANALVAVFNVLPGLPLDGGRIVESTVWKITGSQERGTVAAGWAGRVVAVLLLAAVFVPIYLRDDVPSLSLVLLAALLSSFLWMGAGAAIDNARVRLRLPQVTAAALMAPAVSLPISAPVAQALRLAREHPAAVVVATADTGQPEAVVDAGALASVPPEQAGQIPVSAVARPLAAGAYVPEAATGQELVQYLAQLQGSEYAVINRDGRVTGMLYQAAVVAAVTGKRTRGGR